MVCITYRFSGLGVAVLVWSGGRLLSRCSFHFQRKKINLNFETVTTTLLVPVAARSNAYVFGRSPAEIVGSNPTGGMDVRLL